MSKPAQQASAFAAHFEAKKDSVRQAQSGDWRLTLTLAGGLGLPEKIMLARPGTRYMVALVEIADDETPVPTADPAPAPVEAVEAEKPHRRWEDVPLPNQAGIRCQEPSFAEWLGVESPALAAAEIKRRCRIESRKELASNPRAAAIWREMDKDYAIWLMERDRFGSGQI